MRLPRRSPRLSRHEVVQLGLAAAGAVVGQIVGMFVAMQLADAWQQEAARMAFLAGGLITFTVFGLKLFGIADSREAQEKLQAGIDKLQEGMDELLAGQKVTNAILREILDILKSNKAALDRRGGGAGD